MKKRSLIKNSSGQGLIEYLILVALIAVAAIGIVRTLQHTVKANFAGIIYALQSDGQKRKAQFEKLDENDLKKSDFRDFMNGAANRKSD